MSPKIDMVSSTVGIILMITLASERVSAEEKGGTGVQNEPAPVAAIGSPQGELPPPFSPHRRSSEPSKGIRWDLTMVPHATTRDSVWLSSELVNVSGRTLSFLLQGKAVLELVPTGQEPIRRPLSAPESSPGPSTRQSQRTLLDTRPGPGGTFYGFRVDLRALFGDFKPGDYEVRAVLPRGSFSIAGIAGSDLLEIVSPTMRFHVAEVAPQTALADVPPAYRLIERLDPPNPFTSGALPTGRIRNHNQSPLFVQSRAVQTETGGLPGLPVEVPLGLVRWMGSGSADISHPTASGWSRIKIGPGESLTVQLPDWKTDGDGIYLYWIHVYGDEHGTGAEGLLGQAYSEPFIVDSRGHADNKIEPSTQPVP